MSEPCTHELGEMETAAAWDGLCPICLSADLAALRERHAAEVEAAYREGIGYILSKVWDVERIHAAWLASEAKARLT